MRVKVLAFAGFREILGREREVEMQGDASIRELLEMFASCSPRFREAASEPFCALRDHVLLMVNRKRIDAEKDLYRILADGDELAIFPPLAGG
ncbi:MAG: MoaD/ThiS family protein [Methanothrix sp.]|nr:MoaD/ThiS family protein [Methanothrix sp.]